MRALPTFEYMAARFRVDESGVLYRRVRMGTHSAGEQVGTPDCWGYLSFQHAKRNFQAHCVVWLLTTGAWPTDQIDHISRVKTDNRPENLRECSQKQNAANKTMPAGERSRFRGVTRHAKQAKFQATCAHKYLGVFTTEEAAARAYDARARQAYGEFALLNFGSAE